MSKIRFSYLAIRVLDIPLWAIYNMLLFILYKDLHASAFELALLVALKPFTALISFYFTHLLAHLKLAQTVLLARILGIVPFLLFPFVNNMPFILTAYGLYMAMAVSTTPAWLELMKTNLGNLEQKKTFALGSSLGYLGGALLPFAFALLLDHSPHSWRWIFFGAALLSLVSTLLVVPLLTYSTTPQPMRRDPWRQSLDLLKQRPDFAFFQASFMLLGAGLMVLQTAMPVYFVDELHLTYVELALALALCKGIGYAIASPFLAEKLHQYGIFRFSGLVSLLAILFPLFLMLTKWQILCVYISYIVYGVMQAGSELAWNMSGPLFAGNEESRPYTSLNILTVAVRGALAPFLGVFLLGWCGSFWVQAFGSLLFLAAAGAFLMPAKKRTTEGFLNNRLPDGIS